jgi:predicted NBD/HSP70 family sugar kinase
LANKSCSATGFARWQAACRLQNFGTKLRGGQSEMFKSNKDYIVVDIGGSGVRIGLVTPHGTAGIKRESVQSVDGLVAAIKSRSGNIGGVALSVAGFVNSESGRVILSGCAPWIVGNLRDNLAAKLPHGTQIHIVNDGEAHALALKSYPNIKLGAVNIAIGTGVGFGVLDINGNAVRTLNGDNWDIGDMHIKTRAPNPWVWWCLGEAGIEELKSSMGKEKGLIHYGHRLGFFMTQIAIIFRPQTIGLSGGFITRYWQQIKNGVEAEFQPPSHLPRPDILVQKDEEAALQGLVTLFDSPITATPKSPIITSASSPIITDNTADEYALYADFSKGLSPHFTASEGSHIGASDSVWRERNVSVAGGILRLTIGNTNPKLPNCRYSGAEYVSKKDYRFGYYETSMKAIRQKGVASTFFLFNTENEDEIDIEISGADTKEVIFNCYVKIDGKPKSLMRDEKYHEGIGVPIGFDASQNYHKYGIERQSDSITWFVDGVRKAVLTQSANPKSGVIVRDGVYYCETKYALPSKPARIIMNAWVGKNGQWGSDKKPLSLPVNALYEYVSYKNFEA